MPNPLDGWGDFPKIGLVVEGKKKFYSLKEAIPLWDSGWTRVESARELLMPDFSIRTMTAEENAEFQDRVDDFSARK